MANKATIDRVAFLAGAVFLVCLAGCANHSANVDVGMIEEWLRSSKPERSASQAPRILDWEDVKIQGVPKDRLVWIHYWDGKPCERTSSPAIADVGGFIEETVGRRGDVWLVVQPWDLTSDRLAGLQDLLDVCVASRAKGVIVSEVLYRNERAFRIRVPSPRMPNLSQLIAELEEKRKNQTAQPGATDNPGDAH